MAAKKVAALVAGNPPKIFGGNLGFRFGDSFSEYCLWVVSPLDVEFYGFLESPGWFCDNDLTRMVRLDKKDS